MCLGDVACNEFPRAVCRNLSRLADVKTALQMSKRSCRCLPTWDLPNRTTQIPKLKSKSATHPGLTLREEADVKPRREKSSSTPSCGDLQARCQNAHPDIFRPDICWTVVLKTQIVISNVNDHHGNRFLWCRNQVKWAEFCLGDICPAKRHKFEI